MNTSAKRHVGTGPSKRAPRSKAATAAIVLAVQAVSLAALIFVFYVIAFFAAVRVVPLTLGFIKDGSGVTMDMSVETVVAGWIAPALFLLALLFGLVWVVMRKLWQLRRDLIWRVRTWAYGSEDAVVTRLIPAGIATKARRTTTA